MLRSEREQVERNIQATAVSQHGAFIQAANCLSTINQELQAVSEHLGVLLQASALCLRPAPAATGRQPPSLAELRLDGLDGTRVLGVWPAGALTNAIARDVQGTPELASACEGFSADSAMVLEQYNHNKQLASELARSA